MWNKRLCLPESNFMPEIESQRSYWGIWIFWSFFFHLPLNHSLPLSLKGFQCLDFYKKGTEVWWVTLPVAVIFSFHPSGVYLDFRSHCYSWVACYLHISWLLPLRLFWIINQPPHSGSGIKKINKAFFFLPLSSSKSLYQSGILFLGSHCGTVTTLLEISYPLCSGFPSSVTLIPEDLTPFLTSSGAGTQYGI